MGCSQWFVNVRLPPKCQPLLSDRLGEQGVLPGCIFAFAPRRDCGGRCVCCLQPAREAVWGGPGLPGNQETSVCVCMWTHSMYEVFLHGCWPAGLCTAQRDWRPRHCSEAEGRGPPVAKGLSASPLVVLLVERGLLSGCCRFRGIFLLKYLILWMSVRYEQVNLGAGEASRGFQIPDSGVWGDSCELQVLRIEFGFSGRAVCALNCCAISSLLITIVIILRQGLWR